MTEKPFDAFLVLVCFVFGGIMLVAGFVMGQPARIIIGMGCMMMGLFLLSALDNARKKTRR
jgi:hypothetical protein